MSVLLALMVATLACGTAVPQGPEASAQGFSADVRSPASVGLAWEPVDGASGYSLAASYGPADFLPVANLPADQLSFTHFVVPGAAQVVYRLSATIGDGHSEVGTLDVSLPGFSPNALVVQPSAFAPPAPAFPQIPALPTVDPSNPDPSAIATAMASLGSLNPDDFMAQVETLPEFPRTEIGPEGGVVSLTDPNGVIYTLTFPVDAVQAPTAITLVPIESVVNLPFAGGLLAGVKVLPPIPFGGPAKLTISLPPSSPPASAPLMVGFNVSGSSSEFSLAPVSDAGPNAYILDVYWGDTLGLAAATLDEIEDQAARMPTDPQAQMAQQLAALRAADLERTVEGDYKIAAQVLQGLVAQVDALANGPSRRGGAGLAAPANAPRRVAGLQYETAVKLFSALFWAEPIWNWLNELLPPGTPPPPGSEVARTIGEFRTRIIEEMTPAIKAYMDDHDGCRTGLGLFAETFRQMLRSPKTPFQQALATEYRKRYGPPPDLQCEFRFQVSRSSIREFLPSQGGGLGDLGDSIRIYTVHSEPWSLDLAVREGRLLLRGPVGTQYDAWEWTLNKCPPTVQVHPFPTSLVWITDLSLVFDDDDRVSDFVLQGVAPDRVGGSGDGRGEMDTPSPGQCRLIEVNAGTNPTDVWGIAFSTLHNPGSHLDNWVIEGEDSYVATDTISGRIEGRGLGEFTEDTTIVLTVNQK
jgi:hypothetical protein